jgi:hypothetical protein
MVSEIMGRRLSTDANVDSRTIFDTVTRLINTLEKRLRIDAYALQESHGNGELKAFLWTPLEQNVTDAFTKDPWQAESALRRLMNTNRFDIEATGWCTPHRSMAY